MATTKKERLRLCRKKRHVRASIKRSGSIMMRVSVFRSLKHIYAQVIDDVRGVTVASSSSQFVTEAGDKSFVARKVGEELAKRAREAGCDRVRFDRGNRLYHGRVRALADGLREGGMHL